MTKKPTVGDYVRLLAWGGECEGLILSPKMAGSVGKIFRIDSHGDRRTNSPHPPGFIVDGWGWPESKVELVAGLVGDEVVS